MPKSTRSHKPHVIERIFDLLWDSNSQTLTRTMVTSADVIDAIHWATENKGISLSTKNPANFFKDVIRGSGGEQMWPDKLKNLRWTGYQNTGDGNVLEFVQYKPGQTEAFPEPFKYHQDVARHQIQSLSMPLASKALGRDDETYLIQVAVKLAVVETHFALRSSLKVLELSHLQMGVKLRRTEIDSLFSGRFVDSLDGEQKLLIITAEAKNKGQRILVEQIINQVKAAFQLVPTVEVVVPVAMVARTGGIYLVEFQAVRRSEVAAFDALTLASETFYELCPAVTGI